jgi:hypothetical protein
LNQFPEHRGREKVLKAMGKCQNNNPVHKYHRIDLEGQKNQTATDMIKNSLCFGYDVNYTLPEYKPGLLLIELDSLFYFVVANLIL